MSILSFELSESGLRATIEQGGSNTVKELTFRDKQEHRYKEQLEDFLNESGLRSLHSDEQIVSWSSMRSTLIPSNVFSESKPETLFRLCYGNEIPTSHIDYNRIQEHGLVNLYEIPMWVKSFFVVKFPRSVIQHEGSHLIRGILSSNAFRLKATLIIYDKYFLLTVVQENRLLFYSQFQYLAPEDIIYHLMFSLQQKEILSETSTIELCAGVGCPAGLTEELQSKLGQIKDLQSSQISVQPELILKSLLLCV